jgi:hypothetical protein
MDTEVNMAVTIREVVSKQELKTFVKLPFRFYRGNPNWVPPMILDDISIFNREKNPAFENADCKIFLAYRDGQPVGRIVAILSHVANEKFNVRNMRFGWFESENDREVAAALLGAVEAWAREKGMETITGPQGFCDLDPQGMLIEGFEHLSTIAGIYNQPYYRQLLEENGFEKEIDYVEFRTPVPGDESGVPEKLIRLAERVKERSKLHVLHFARKKDLIKRIPDIFDVLDEAFEEIYGAVPLTRRQVEYFVGKYFSHVDKDMIKAVANEKDELVGFMVTMPSFSRAMQKSHGRLLPFGWYHLLKAFKQNDTLDFYLMGIKRAYRGLGVDLLMVIEIVKTAMAKGFKMAESNQELETNNKIQAQWKYFNPVQHKRRRVFKKTMAK